MKPALVVCTCLSEKDVREQQRLKNKVPAGQVPRRSVTPYTRHHLLLLCPGLGSSSAVAQALQFVQVTSFTPSPEPVQGMTGDLNGDGKPDLVVVGDDGCGVPSNGYALLGKGDGTFGPATSFTMGTVGNSVPGQSALAKHQWELGLDRTERRL
jgi:hypothetical protein